MKIKNDKYYTSNELAKYVVSKANEIIGSEYITEYLEPSAGDGVFLPYLDKKYIAIDIEPENSNIIKANYLEYNLEYKKGRCTIGNPPFGERNLLVKKFINKAIKECDYIVFILPIGQLNNTATIYEFDLIYSENLGNKEFSGIYINCCLNIYRRPKNGILNKKITYKYNDIILKRVNRGVDKIPLKYNFTICRWGTSVGNFCNENQYANQYYITINNKNKEEKIIELFKNVDWYKEYQFISTPCLSNIMVYNYLKKHIDLE